MGDKMWRWGTLALALVVAGGCGGSPPPAPKPVNLPEASPQTPPAAPAGASVGKKAPASTSLPALPKVPEVKPLPPIAYEAKGRPDPFRSLAGRDSGESKGLTVASIKLVGVIQGRQGPLALVETPDGLGYIVKPGDVVGDGKVTEIGRDSVTFELGRRGPFVLRLRTE
ncbi:MAG TPA: hypothetical protein VJO34_01705 [Methylomirabilota bacterium]|nr:hypothetical protein [Methylomirabilota bacterium]